MHIVNKCCKVLLYDFFQDSQVDDWFKWREISRDVSDMEPSDVGSRHVSLCREVCSTKSRGLGSIFDDTELAQAFIRCCDTG